jgi:hypothetical protein
MGIKLTYEVVLELKVLERLWTSEGPGWNPGQLVAVELQILKNKKVCSNNL